mgnify:CR=1 FL=1
MVSLDENGKPSPVPKLVYDENNAYESKLYKVGEKKHILHKSEKILIYDLFAICFRICYNIKAV